MYDVTALRIVLSQDVDRLCEMNTIPISRVLPVTEIAIGRLSDKSAIVKKVLHVIFKPSHHVVCLDMTGYVVVCTSYFFLQTKRTGLTACEKRFEDAKTKLTQCEASEQSLAQKVLDGEDTKENGEELSNARKSQAKIVEFYESLVCFVKMFEESSETICNMLHSENSTDVIEALRLIAVLHEERLEGVNFAAQAMLELVWSSNQEHRKAVVNVSTSSRGRNSNSPVMCKTHLCYVGVQCGNSRLFESCDWYSSKRATYSHNTHCNVWKLVRSEEDAKVIAKSVFSKSEENEVRQFVKVHWQS